MIAMFISLLFFSSLSQNRLEAREISVYYQFKDHPVETIKGVDVISVPGEEYQAPQQATQAREGRNDALGFLQEIKEESRSLYLNIKNSIDKTILTVVPNSFRRCLNPAKLGYSTTGHGRIYLCDRALNNHSLTVLGVLQGAIERTHLRNKHKVKAWVAKRLGKF